MGEAARRIIGYAEKSFLAMRDPYHTVRRVFPRVLEEVGRDRDARYLGVKDRREIPGSFVRRLRGFGYLLHTLDASSPGGRAIDTLMANPLTGRPMTGSTSGGAINVRIGINDVALGTDGGGSVLGPALSLCLYGFISPLLAREEMARWRKVSTDGLEFVPSLGFITRSLGEMRRIVGKFFPLEDESDVAVDWEVLEKGNEAKDRRTLIAKIRPFLDKGHVLAFAEGPVDVQGLGDTVLGHLGPVASSIQAKGGKGVLRVANMLGATALALPRGDIGSGVLLLCGSEPRMVSKLLGAASRFARPEDGLLDRYFSSFATYEPWGYGEDG